jgi:uncharacterized delta-60 repeat protein
VASLVIPAAAGARPGELDRGFNGDGKVVTVFPNPERVRSYPDYQLPFEFAPGRVAMASGPEGKLIVASSKAIVEYAANGARERRFGGNGTVPIEQIEGLNFQLADVAVDSRGRVLVAGTTKETTGIGMGGPPVAGPIPSVATIRRYLPNGVPDPSFGFGGRSISYLGAPPPTFEGRAYPEPAVSVTGLTVDAKDRPVLVGSLVGEVGRCRATEARFERSYAFVARMADDGGPDPSFEDGATRGIRELSWLSSPTPAPSGVFAIGAATDPCGNPGKDEPSSVVSIGNEGPRGPFGGNGFWSRHFMRVSDLAVASGGKVVLLARTVELSRGKWIESAGRAIRLRRDGSLDRSFGRRGEAEVRLPKGGSIVAIATDAKGRVLLAGTVKRKPRSKKRARLRFLLIRTTAGGKPDREFGSRGRVTTAFGKRSSVRTTGVLVDPKGRIAVGGKFAGDSNHEAFALARYQAGR